MFILSESNSIACHFLGELRDRNIQNDRMRFRRNLERLGEIMAYEISKKMHYHATEIRTPLGVRRVSNLDQNPVIITILRAGLPFFQGFINYFEHAACGFIGAFRQNEGNFDEVSIQLGYRAISDINNKEVIIADPMLATGKSLVKAIDQLTDYGIPSKIHIASAIAAPEGVAYLDQQISLEYELWLGDLDERLNERAYIIPGLGDAGDLAYGKKN